MVYIFEQTPTGYKMDKNIVCIDLDGTLAHYDEWKGESHLGAVIANSSKALKMLKEKNWLIIIFTTRSNKELIKNFLSDNDIPFDYINENPYQPENAFAGKPYADVYIDDRAVQFNGDWESTIKEVLDFQPWEKRHNYSNERIRVAKDFLFHDFDQSYQQLRHYDSLSWDITKFSFIELLVGIAAVWAIYSFAQNPEKSHSLISEYYLLLIPTIFGISYVFSILASFLISRNRVYFSKVAKYLNEHRSFSLNVRPLGFENKTNFYTNTSFPPAYDAWSTHLVSLYVIQFISAIIFSAMLFFILLNWLDRGIWIYIISGMAGCMSFVINLLVFIKYLKKQDDKFGK